MDKTYNSVVFNSIENVKDFFSLSREEFFNNLYTYSSDDGSMCLSLNVTGNKVLVEIFYGGQTPKITCLSNLDLEKELNHNFIQEYYS